MCSFWVFLSILFILLIFSISLFIQKLLFIFLTSVFIITFIPRPFFLFLPSFFLLTFFLFLFLHYSITSDIATAITQDSCEQYWTSPRVNNPQGTNSTAICLLSQKLSKLDEPDMQDTVGEAETSSSVMYSYGPLHIAEQKQDDQLENTFSSYVRIRDVALKTCQRRWTIGRSGKRVSGISMLAARHDDYVDDDDDFSLGTVSFTVIIRENEIDETNSNTKRDY